jgi:subtilisin-like proprotein convertase family protein
MVTTPQSTRGHEYCIDNCIPPGYSNSRFYENIGSAAELTAHINNGTEGIIYSGHGGELGWERFDYSALALRGLSNILHAPVIVGHCCAAANFNESVCFGEAWLQTTARGVAYVGASDITYWDQDEQMQQGEFDAMAGTGKLSIGKAMEEGLLRVHQLSPGQSRYYHTAYNLLGDPTLVMFESVSPPLAIRTPFELPAANSSLPYSIMLRATGGTPPYFWSLSANQLPEGLRLSTGGVISGTPVTIGTHRFELQVADSGTAKQIASATFTLPVWDLTAGLNQALETTNWPWASGGDAYWLNQPIVTFDGFDAAESGSIEDNSQTWMETSVTGPGTLSFWWKVSSEPLYDFLEFYINGILQSGRIAGAADWELRTYVLREGQQTLRWRYVKDDSISRNQDRGWVDQITWRPDSPLPGILQQPTSNTVCVGQPATFTVIATGEKPLAYQWFRGHVPLVQMTNSTYSLFSPHQSDSDSYTVVITNVYGAITSASASLVVIPPESIVTNWFDSPVIVTIPETGVATPYPATLLVSNVAGTVHQVTVTLTGLTHSYPSDLAILLVGPSGLPVMLMGGAGNSEGINNVTLSFDQIAGLEMPSSFSGSGTYRPSDRSRGFVLPAPAPQRPYGTSLSGFNGLNPNGTWKLFAADAARDDAGCIADGWKLRLVVVQASGLPRILNPALERDTIRFSFETLTGRTYCVEHCYAPGGTDWQLLQTVRGSGCLETLSFARDREAQRFYRLRVE